MKPNINPLLVIYLPLLTFRQIAGEILIRECEGLNFGFILSLWKEPGPLVRKLRLIHLPWPSGTPDRHGHLKHMPLKSAKVPTLLAPILIFLAGCGDKKETLTPQLQDITESVYASVTVQPDSMYLAHAAVTGILERNLVEEGQLVKDGGLLLRVTDRSPELTTENARLQMELAIANYRGENSVLKDLAAQIRTAELTFEDDSLNYRRQEKLWAQQIGSKAAFEARQLAYQRSGNQLAQLKSEYHRMENELRTKVDQARNAYESSRANSEEFTLRSTINGRVYALYKEPGEVVLPNEPLAMIGSPDTFLAELLVDEVDVVRVRTGQIALISLDAYGDQVFQAVVDKIYPQKDPRNQTFKVEARFSEPPGTLYPGLSGEANIVIARREGVLTIPRSYLVGKDSVLTPDGMRKVTTGLHTLERVEITSGLEPGTQLLNPNE